MDGEKLSYFVRGAVGRQGLGAWAHRLAATRAGFLLADPLGESFDAAMLGIAARQPDVILTFVCFQPIDMGGGEWRMS